MTDRFGPGLAIEVEGLGFAYRPGAWVLRDCSLSVSRGRVLAVLGPNGRGKTTLLKLMAGILSPREGRVQVGGTVAFLPQALHVHFPYTVFEMVLMGRARQVGLFAVPTKEDEDVAWNAIDRLELAPLGRRPFDQLSGGERQLVLFARALATQADTLILDEPIAGLDLRNQGLILGWIRRLAGEGLTVVFTTHQPQHADAVADDVTLLLAANRHVSGTAPQTMTEENLLALFGVELRRLKIESGGRPVTAIVPIWRV